MTTRPFGALRTTATVTEDEPGHLGETVRQPRHLIPGVKVRNDGVYAATLVSGLVYRLAHDGVGWQLTPEDERPHAYLVDVDLEPVGELELADGVLVLRRDRRYTIAEDRAGAWGVHEDLPAMSRHL